MLLVADSAAVVLLAGDLVGPRGRASPEQGGRGRRRRACGQGRGPMPARLGLGRGPPQFVLDLEPGAPPQRMSAGSELDLVAVASADQIDVVVSCGRGDRLLHPVAAVCVSSGLVGMSWRLDAGAAAPGGGSCDVEAGVVALVLSGVHGREDGVMTGE